MARRVVEQVREHLGELAVVGVEQWQGVGQVGADVDVTQERCEGAEPLGDELAEVDGLPLGRERAGLDPAEAEQVGDEPVEAVDLVAHRRQELVSRRGVVLDTVAQIGDDGAHGRQGRAQVVGDRPQQRGPLTVERLELLGPGGPARELRAFTLELGHVLVELAHLALRDAHLAPAVHDPRDEPTDEHRDHHERDELDDLVGVADRERAVRLDVTEVEGDRRRDRGDDRGRSATHDGRADHDHDEQQRDGGRGQVRACRQQRDPEEDAGGDTERDPQTRRGPGARQTAHGVILTRSLRPVPGP